MNIKIIGVGKVKEKYFKVGIVEYVKWMECYVKFEIVEVLDEKVFEIFSQVEMDVVMVKEGEWILVKIKDWEYVYVLVIKGKECFLEEFVKEINQLVIYGYFDIIFVIGGFLGFSLVVLKWVNIQIFFGCFILFYKLMCLVLVE